jgi:hypothetical protein
VGTSLSPLQSPGYREKPVEISEKSPINRVWRKIRKTSETKGMLFHQSSVASRKSRR